jgi:hypothetical protein
MKMSGHTLGTPRSGAFAPTSLARLIARTSLVMAAGMIGLLDAPPLAAQTARVVRRAPEYYRLQLKHNLKYLDAKHCTDAVGMNPGSDFEGGACQLWRLVPVGDGWQRLQLKRGEKFLDARFCSDTLGLNPGSDFEGGACQLWRLVDAGDGWSRLQLKRGGKYLDATHCGDDVSLNPGSGFNGGACQLWRLVPERAGALTQMIHPSTPLATHSPILGGRGVISGGVIGGTRIPDAPATPAPAAAGTPAKRGFDDAGQPYVDEPLPDGSVKRTQPNGVTIIAPDGTKRFIPKSVIRMNAQPPTPPSLPSDPTQGRAWLERHNDDLLDLIRGLVRYDEAEMSKFQTGERKVATDDLFKQILYRTEIAEFLALNR